MSDCYTGTIMQQIQQGIRQRPIFLLHKKTKQYCKFISAKLDCIRHLIFFQPFCSSPRGYHVKGCLNSRSAKPQRNLSHLLKTRYLIEICLRRPGEFNFVMLSGRGTHATQTAYTIRISFSLTHPSPPLLPASHPSP